MTKNFKITLVITICVVVMVCVYVAIGKNRYSNETPVLPVQEIQEPEEINVGVSKPAPVAAQEKLKELQAQINAGSITPEEAMKQIDAFNNANLPPVQAIVKQ